jgi:hypothetical protein
MRHLTAEEFEDILSGGAGIPEHVDWCRRCSASLHEKYVLAHRLQRAFSSIHAVSGLIDRIRAQIAAGAAAATA